MKNSKILAGAYTRAQYTEYGDLNEQVENKIKDAFIQGFNSGRKLKWNSVNDKLPKSDHHCLCWVKNEVNINYSSFETGSYQNNNWYLKGGRQTHEIVTHWIKIEKPS